MVGACQMESKASHPTHEIVFEEVAATMNAEVRGSNADAARGWAAERSDGCSHHMQA